MSIVVIGTSFVDIKGFPLGEFIPTGRNSSEVIQTHGGVARNIAEDIANLGLSVSFVSLVDDNGSGRDVVEHLEDCEVDTRYIKRINGGMGTWLVILDEKGDVFANVSKRPDLTPIEGILEEHGDEIFAQADSILIEIDMKEEVIYKIYKLAEKYGKDVYACISNMTIAQARIKYMSKSKLLVFNQQEAGILFANNPNITIAELRDHLVEYKRKIGCENIVVTLGSNGAMYVKKDAEYPGLCESMETNVVDTTGAGDSFFAGVAAAMTRGKSLREACLIGTKMASRVISSYGSVYRRMESDDVNV